MTPTLYQTLLGAAFFRLPDALRALHGVHGTARYSGQVTVVRGAGLLSRLCARIAGLPRAMTDAPVTPLYHERTIRLLRPDVRDMPLNAMDLRDLGRVWSDATISR